MERKNPGKNKTLMYKFSMVHFLSIKTSLTMSNQA
jgi:hypothetical protein